MQISWIKKTTLLDYPWKVACLIFTPWCNFRCPFCYNPEFVLPEKLNQTLKDLISEEAFFNFLKERGDFLDWVVICWWEPTLQHDLYDFCKKIKEKKLLLKLDTNGQNPIILKKLINDWLLDFVSMDIKHSFEHYSQLCWIDVDLTPYKESIKILINSKIDYEFRTTVIKWYHKAQDIESIWNSIKWAKKYCLQNFIWWNTLDPNFNWKSFTHEELTELKDILSKYVNKCEIRE